MLLWISDLYCCNLLEDLVLVVWVRVGSECEGFSIGMLFIEMLDWW